MQALAATEPVRLASATEAEAEAVDDVVSLSQLSAIASRFLAPSLSPPGPADVVPSSINIFSSSLYFANRGICNLQERVDSYRQAADRGDADGHVPCPPASQPITAPPVESPASGAMPVRWLHSSISFVSLLGFLQ
jgi:hypothetical protein